MTRKLLPSLLVIAFYLIFGLPAYSQNVISRSSPVNLFNNLDATGISILNSGKTLFREPKNWNDLSIPASAPFYGEVQEMVRKVNPNYIGEVLLLMPRDKASIILPGVLDRLLAFEHYAGVPYWSKQRSRYYNLFDWVKITSDLKMGTIGSVETRQYMKPFGEYGSTYVWSLSEKSILFSGINTTTLSYDAIKAVSPGNMVWQLNAYIVDDYWLFYGLGTVKAFDLFGAMRERLTTSLMGRIEAFFRYVYGDLIH